MRLKEMFLMLVVISLVAGIMLTDVRIKRISFQQRSLEDKTSLKRVTASQTANRLLHPFNQITADK